MKVTLNKTNLRSLIKEMARVFISFRLSIISSICFSTPDPILIILLMSTKWLVTFSPVVLQLSYALSITFRKLRHSVYPNNSCNSLASQNSIPSFSYANPSKRWLSF